jgi:Ca2+-transporting ATPase
MALTVLAITQWFNAWNCRSETKSIFSRDIFSNLYLIAATVIVILLQLAAVYLPFFQRILHTTRLTSHDWLFAFGISALIIVIDEIRKGIVRRRL